jgi:alpha-D-ribose 1-methylphosphonate 5-triphosphate diphosphatase
MSTVRICGRRLMWEGEPRTGTMTIVDGRITGFEAGAASPGAIHAGESWVLPGIVDVHGDGFERQWFPRPAVFFDLRIALEETDRQLLSNGITTAFHGLTVSWEPGLRGLDSATRFLREFGRVRSRLRCDTRIHLRFETSNFEAESTVAEWIRSGEIHLLAFNDHLDFIGGRLDKPQLVARYADRTGLSVDEYCERHAAVSQRRAEIPGLVERLAAAGRSLRLPMASHDDDSPETTAWFQSIGCRITEFPVNKVTAEAARTLGNSIVLGAPNVVRGGSHARRLTAADMIRAGLCDALSSDYYYPSLLLAAFQLSRDQVLPLARAWALVSEGPAKAAGLLDRGVLATGKRADVLLVDEDESGWPHLRAAFVAGECVYQTEPVMEAALR